MFATRNNSQILDKILKFPASQPVCDVHSAVHSSIDLMLYTKKTLCWLLSDIL